LECDFVKSSIGRIAESFLLAAQWKLAQFSWTAVPLLDPNGDRISCYGSHKPGFGKTLVASGGKIAAVQHIVRRVLFSPSFADW